MDGKAGRTRTAGVGGVSIGGGQSTVLCYDLHAGFGYRPQGSIGV